MTVLGKFTKQPREIDWYAVQFADDMTADDDIQGGYGALALSGMVETDLSAPYTGLAGDTGLLLYTGYSVTLSSQASIGNVLAVSNIDQDAAITVGAFTVPARGTVIVRQTAAGWIEEASGTVVIVSVPGDHRIRMLIAGGVNGTAYKAQFTAITSQGRELEDEILLRVKEI